MSATPDEPPAVLPGPVRHRVVTLTSRALDDIDQRQTPVSLRKVARFTPSRRARLAATAMASAVATDDSFRERVAAFVRSELADVVAAIDEGSVAALDPVDVAATAYLTRPDGWQATMAVAVEMLEADREATAASAAEEADTVERMRTQLDGLREELRSARAAHRAELDGLKADNTDLRRKLGDARNRVRDAEQEQARLAAAAESAQERENARTSDAEAEVRRMRQRLDAALAEAGDRRRQARDDRAATSTRARLLLDSVIEGAQGLRRELALPPIEAMPADRVGEAAEADDAQRNHAVVGDASRLRTLLELPRLHLVVDGYNVTKAVWETLPLDRQRNLLVAELGAVAARTSVEVTVVFDGADVAVPAAKPSARGVRVLFSAAGVTADAVIADLVGAEPQGRPIVVVSSDAEVSAHARRSGGRPATARALAGLFERS